MSKTQMSKSLEKIVINESEGLVFESESDLYDHFSDDIVKLEREFFSLRDEHDIPESQFGDYEENLGVTLENPDEIWEDTSSLQDKPVFIYIKKFEETLYHVAACYLTDE